VRKVDITRTAVVANGFTLEGYENSPEAVTYVPMVPRWNIIRGINGRMAVVKRKGPGYGVLSIRLLATSKSNAVFTSFMLADVILPFMQVLVIPDGSNDAIILPNCVVTGPPTKYSVGNSVGTNEWVLLCPGGIPLALGALS